MSTLPEKTEARQLLKNSEWAELTFRQLRKDAELCGLDWPEAPLPASYEEWIQFILEKLQSMEKQNPEYLSRFLYRVDLSESHFLQAPFPSEEMAEAVLKREFMKVWFKNQYR